MVCRVAIASPNANAANPSASGKPNGRLRARTATAMPARANIDVAHRFAIGGEVANDAEPESNGQPGYQAAGRNLGCGPLCNQPTQPPGRVGDAFGEQQARRTATKIRCPRFGANTLLAAIGTRSRHCVGRLPDATRYNLSYLNSSAGCGHWFQSACGFLLGAVLGLVLRPILGPCVAQANGAAEYRLA